MTHEHKLAKVMASIPTLGNAIFIFPITRASKTAIQHTRIRRKVGNGVSHTQQQGSYVPPTYPAICVI